MENLLKRNWFICSKGYDIKKDYILKKKDLLGSGSYGDVYTGIHKLTE